MRSGFTARLLIHGGVIVALLGPAEACGRFGYDPTPRADSARSSDTGDGSVVLAASGGRASGTGGAGSIGGSPGGTGGSRATGGSDATGGAGGASNGTGGGSGGTDADAAAPGTGGALDGGCVPAPYYADADADGAGNANDVVLACDPPQNRVLVAGDCDDTTAFVHPGAIEVCDLVDDDCDGAIDETGCPADSVGSVWNGTPYLLIKTGLTWADARAACESANLRMVQIDSQPEQDHLWALGGGVTFWIGATDQAVEGEWVWTSGKQFWTGGLNGQSVGGAYQDWKAGTDPQDALSAEDCGTAFAPHGGLWADEPCGSSYPVVCEGGP